MNKKCIRLSNKKYEEDELKVSNQPCPKRVKVKGSVNLICSYKG